MSASFSQFTPPAEAGISAVSLYDGFRGAIIGWLLRIYLSPAHLARLHAACRFGTGFMRAEIMLSSPATGCRRRRRLLSMAQTFILAFTAANRHRGACQHKMPPPHADILGTARSRRAGYDDDD